MIGTSNAFSIRQEARNVAESVAMGRIISIPSGSPVTVDGKVSPKEWADCESLKISADLDWKIPVRFKHARNLYFQFTRVTNGKNRLFPELFFDPQDKKSHDWEKGNWWFHVSANLCESDGEPNVYEKNGVFQCAHKKQGWQANNPPETDTIEISIALARSAEKEVKADKWRAPLHGIPIGIKDFYDTAGVKTTAAIEHLRDRVPTKDALAVTMRKKAGAIVG